MNEKYDVDFQTFRDNDRVTILSFMSKQIGYNFMIIPHFDNCKLVMLRGIIASIVCLFQLGIFFILLMNISEVIFFHNFDNILCFYFLTIFLSTIDLLIYPFSRTRNLEIPIDWEVLSLQKKSC